ncbi:MAG: response regulator [Phycisphaerales bacterium]|nr:response regulator [Phycisphaerales bacterium]
MPQPPKHRSEVEMDQPRILAIDDDHNQLASLERIFRRSGFEIFKSSNGRDGLRKALRLVPDLILLDVTMPRMSGHEFLRRFRRLERRFGTSAAQNLPETPVIFLTARARLHQRIDGLDAGAADYITKPFDADELRARVRRALRDARRLRGLSPGEAA